MQRSDFHEFSNRSNRIHCNVILCLPSPCTLCLCGYFTNSGTTSSGSTPAAWPWARNSATAWRPRGPKSSVQSFTYMPTNLSACLSSRSRPYCRAYVQRVLAVGQAVLDALLEQPLDLADGFRAQILADGVGAQRQRQAGVLLPPVAQIDDELQVLLAERELPFVNDQPGVDRLAVVLAGHDGRNDLVERHFDAGKIRAQAQPQRQVRTGQLARHGDRAPRQLVDAHRLRGHDHRPVAVAHAGAAGAQNVFVVQESVGVNADGGELQLALNARRLSVSMSTSSC